MKTCRWCNARQWCGFSYHHDDCPMITDVYPASSDMRCLDCLEPMDYYTHVEVEGAHLVTCLGCAALMAVEA